MRCGGSIDYYHNGFFVVGVVGGVSALGVFSVCSGFVSRKGARQRERGN